MIRRALQSLLRTFDRRLQCESTWQLLEAERCALRELYAHSSDAPLALAAHPATVEGIVFSKDRPLQLFALLESYFAHAETPAPLSVLFKATSAAHSAAYREVFASLPEGVTAIPEGHFRDDLRTLLSQTSSDRVFFLVDDIIFIEPFSLAELARFSPRHFVPTLRMGAGLDYCYTRSVPQAEPPYRRGVVDVARFIAWLFREGEHEYGFPLSLDGHLYDRRELAIMAAHSDFAGPNTFERIIQLYLPAFANRYAVAYRKARLVNAPWNRVQVEWDSRHSGQDSEALLRAWQQGLQVDTAALAGYPNRSTHEEVPLHLIPRAASLRPA